MAARRRGIGAGDRARTVAILVYGGVQSLDVTGPFEVFAGANALLGARERAPGYELSLLSRDGAPVSSSSGLRITPDHDLAHAPAPLDTLILPGGWGHGDAERDEQLIAWIAEASATARRTVSVCTGAFLLARAGLLAGRRATTHWASAARLAESYPDVEVDPDPIFVREGSLWTSAGVTAGIDLALAMVEEDHGRDLTLATARELVMFLRRPGGQAQFSAQLAVQFAEHEPLRELQAHILEHPGTDLEVATLARRVAMSPRNFARVFAREIGMTPARFVTSVRVETARRRLEETSDDLLAICEGCGFGSLESMRRAFLSLVGTPPGQYRERFNRHHPRADGVVNGRLTARRMS